MGQLTLLVASAVIAFVGWGWVKERFVPKPLDQARMEERMKKEGTLKADGTIAVDREFDAELNALARELKAIDADVSAELDAGASVQ